MIRPLRTLVLLASLLAAIATTATAAAGTPRVVVSIEPFAGIVAAVMDGAGAPEVLIAAGGSPHAYALRPSDAARLGSADLVIWGGPDLELALARPIGQLAAKARVLELAALDGLVLHDYRDETPSGEGHDGGDRHAGHDMHVWLDPDNAAVIAGAVAAALADGDPGNAALYRRNADAFRSRVAALKQEVAALLAPVRGRPFVVFHDAYQYFEKRFDFPARAAIALSPERQPGVRHVAEIRRLIADGGVVCVFAEPQFEPRLIATLIEGTNARAATLDPLGSAIDGGPGYYPALIRALATALTDCLGN